MSSIFGLRSSYMLEYCWLFTLLLRSAKYFTGIERKWTLLPPIWPPFADRVTGLQCLRLCGWDEKIHTDYRVFIMIKATYDKLTTNAVMAHVRFYMIIIIVQFHKTSELVCICLYCVISGFEISEGTRNTLKIMIFTSQYYFPWSLSNAGRI